MSNAYPRRTLPMVATADEFASFLQADIRKWLGVAVRANIKATD
ncbi:MAG: hypothetical protein Q8N17_23530 [Burkholderiaceae bacterium]|nr:hypothetical protein [Burkholderiaceae bacterium]